MRVLLTVVETVIIGQCRWAWLLHSLVIFRCVGSLACVTRSFFRERRRLRQFTFSRSRLLLRNIQLCGWAPSGQWRLTVCVVDCCLGVEVYARYSCLNDAHCVVVKPLDLYVFECGLMSVYLTSWQRGPFLIKQATLFAPFPCRISVTYTLHVCSWPC